MISKNENNNQYVQRIRDSGLSIYDQIEIGDPDFWIPSDALEYLLNRYMVGISLSGLPLRTRSKVVKEHVCKALGYPVPASFKKTQPRFLGQNLDVYTQKSNNLQVWNEELSSTRRYVLVRINEDDAITKVKVVTGDTLASLDTTGTLTQKYQARLIPKESSTELISKEDTALLQAFTDLNTVLGEEVSPTDYPENKKILPIKSIYDRLISLIGQTFADVGYDQERNRGAALHRLICHHLGYNDYKDDGRFPDVRQQLLEVKLQTSPTIDLGLVCPNSNEPLDIPQIGDKQIRHCDVRYAIFYAQTDGKMVTLTHFFLSTGESFFSRFPQFQGKVLNKKIQIPLPADFFED